MLWMFLAFGLAMAGEPSQTSGPTMFELETQFFAAVPADYPFAASSYVETPATIDEAGFRAAVAPYLDSVNRVQAATGHYRPAEPPSWFMPRRSNLWGEEMAFYLARKPPIAVTPDERHTDALPDAAQRVTPAKLLFADAAKTRLAAASYSWRSTDLALGVLWETSAQVHAVYDERSRVTALFLRLRDNGSDGNTWMPEDRLVRFEYDERGKISVITEISRSESIEPDDADVAVRSVVVQARRLTPEKER